MKRLRFSCLALLALSSVLFAQTSMTPGLQNAPARRSPLAEYAGAWIGTFEGRAWMTIRLSLQANQFSGTVQRPQDIKFNDQGEIKSIGDVQSTAAVQNAVLQGDGLLVTVKNPDSQQPERYLLRLTSANTAEVKMVAMSMPPGMPKPKPWKVNRVMPSAVTPMR